MGRTKEANYVSHSLHNAAHPSHSAAPRPPRQHLPPTPTHSPPIPHQKGVPKKNDGEAFGALLDTKCFEEMAAAMT